MDESYATSRCRHILYGIMHIEEIRKENCHHADKTAFIEKTENANKFFFFIRPRRFGKSLALGMLHYDYDLLCKEQFEPLFGELYIEMSSCEEY